MNSNIASPKALGFGVLAIALWMYSLIHSGLVNAMAIDPSVLHMAMTIAALGLLIAGIMAFLRHEGWLAFFFLLWAGITWSSAQGVAHHAMMNQGDMRFIAWFGIAVALVNLYLWLATRGASKLGGAVSFMVLLLWLSMLALGLEAFLGVWVLDRIGGALGLASALVAFYVSAGSLARQCCSNMSLPGIPAEE